MLNARKHEASLGALAVGTLFLLLGLSLYFGAVARCGDAGVIIGENCVRSRGGADGSPRRPITQEDVDGVKQGRRAVGEVVLVLGSLLVLGACGSAVIEGRGGRPVRARLPLTAEQARGGGTASVGYRTRLRCPRCRGTGVRAGGREWRCARCWGSGGGRRARRTVTVRIPVGVRDGSTLRARGRGMPGRGAEPAGDLILSVRIAGASRRSGPAAAPGRRRAPAPSRPAAESAPHRGRATAAPDAVSGPVAIEAGGIRIAADLPSLTVHEERRSSGGRVAWVITHEIRWPDIALLVFDSDRHDPVVALYAILRDATGTGPGRQHLADARGFTSADWEALAAGIDRHSRGGAALDLASRREPGGPRDS
nr:hypothetical protein OG461_34450 [Streptomyces sp. NBC_00995]